MATDVRLYLKHHITELNELIHSTLNVLGAFAERHKATVFPGFTHLQIVQPVVLGHHICAYIEKIKRDQTVWRMRLSEPMCAHWDLRQWRGQLWD